MEALKKLTEHLEQRMVDYQQAKEQGTKMVGYVPNGYLPDELITACSPKAMPIPIIRGGEHEPVLYSGAYIPRWVNTFYKAQVGYKMLGENTLYNMVDLLVNALVDSNQRAMADTWTFFTGIPSYLFGVPHEKTEIGLEYYYDGVKLFKEKLEELIGTSIEEQKIIEAIEQINRENRLLKEISLLRKAEQPPISGMDFIKLYHSTFMADKKVSNEILEELFTFLKNNRKHDSSSHRPRLLLTGDILATGDYKIINIIQEMGADIVIEYFDMGASAYWNEIEVGNDLLKSIAESHFMKKLPCCVFRISNERQDFILDLAKDFNVDGIISYELMYAECVQIETFSFAKKLKKELGIPILRVYSDYDVGGETGALRTRIETFIETIRR